MRIGLAGSSAGADVQSLLSEQRRDLIDCGVTA